MPAKPFPKGNKLAKGGARPGAGRPPNWYRDICAELLEKNKLFEYRAKVAMGEKVEVSLTAGKDGVKSEAVEPKADTRLQAIRDLEYTAFGKPPQALQVTGEMKVNLVSVVRRARAARGLPDK